MTCTDKTGLRGAGGRSGCSAGDSLSFNLRTEPSERFEPSLSWLHLQRAQKTSRSHLPCPPHRTLSISSLTRDRPPFNILLHYWTKPSPALQLGCELLTCMYLLLLSSLCLPDLTPAQFSTHLFSHSSLSPFLPSGPLRGRFGKFASLPLSL